VNAAMRGAAFGAKGSPTTPGMTDLEVRQALAAQIGNYGVGAGKLAKNDWIPLFRAAFHDYDSPPEKLVTTNTISNAIAAFERTMTFTHTPWRAYVRGDAKAISEKAKRGAYLFFTAWDQGGAGCSGCHKGDFFTDEKYYDLAVPQIGRGKTDLDNLADGIDDWGRGHVTGNRDDKYDYRTPTLLGVEVTGPYGHSGAFNTLEQVVRHHLNVEASIASFDYKSISTAGGPINASFSKENTNYELQKLIALRAAGSPRAIRNVDLPASDVDALVAFLKSLTDPCLKSKSCLAQWIPSARDPDPDGLRLCAKDGQGRELLPGSCPGHARREASR
jgi:cytochrome c peroxidase